jgi:hypothetical protein
MCNGQKPSFYVRWTKNYVECIFVPKTYVRHTYLCIDILSGSQGCLVFVCVCVNEFLCMFDILRAMDKTYVHHTYLRIDILRAMDTINGCH